MNSGEPVRGKAKQLEELLEPTIRALGCELWGIDYQSRGTHAKVCVYIDADSGVSVDDCEAVSHQVSGILDVEDLFSHPYTLEVSSPGLDRVLFKPEQYASSVGLDVDVRLHVPVDGTRRIKGLLTGFENDELVVGAGEDEYVIPREQVRVARIVPSFD